MQITVVRCLDARLIRVRVGIYERDDTREERNVKYFIQHEAYAHGIQRHDIALLRLDQRVNSSIEKVKLSEASDVFSSEVKCHVAGWGNTALDVPLKKPGILQELTVPLVTRPTCKKMYKDTLTVFDDSVFCAGFENTKSGTCQGDSGGPLMCSSETRQNCRVQLGIVNLSDGCGGKPTIFVNVTYYLSWIAEKTRRQL